MESWNRRQESGSALAPNQIFAPEWTFPDDGLDADTRRFAKQWLVLSYHVVALAVWSLQDA